MSKRVTTRWYIGAWVVWLIALVAYVAMSRPVSGSAPPPAAIVASLVASLAGIVMLVMWIGALIKLGQQHAWGWFAAVLVLHLIALGIVAMVAYAVAGPEESERIVTRPAVS